MELKQQEKALKLPYRSLLIVPYGIETTSVTSFRAFFESF